MMGRCFHWCRVAKTVYPLASYREAFILATQPQIRPYSSPFALLFSVASLKWFMCYPIVLSIWVLCFLEKMAMDSDASDTEDENNMTVKDAAPSSSSSFSSSQSSGI